MHTADSGGARARTSLQGRLSAPTRATAVPRRCEAALDCTKSSAGGLCPLCAPLTAKTQTRRAPSTPQNRTRVVRTLEHYAAAQCAHQTHKGAL